MERSAQHWIVLKHVNLNANVYKVNYAVAEGQVVDACLE
jgi:hypothetical protein